MKKHHLDEQDLGVEEEVSQTDEENEVVAKDIFEALGLQTGYSNVGKG